MRFVLMNLPETHASFLEASSHCGFQRNSPMSALAYCAESRDISVGIHHGLRNPTIATCMRLNLGKSPCALGLALWISMVGSEP